MLLETIKFYKRQLHNIEFHNARMNLARKNLFNSSDIIYLEEAIEYPDSIDDGLYKCRIIYNETIRSIEFLLYEKKKIETLKLVVDDEIEYNYKYENRENLNILYGKKEQCDDILIIKRDLVTDTSFCNVVLSDGNNWVTPSSPLLKGTKRESLLKRKLIIEKEIKLKDLKKYKKISLINALIDLEEYVIEMDHLLS